MAVAAAAKAKAEAEADGKSKSTFFGGFTYISSPSPSAAHWKAASKP